MTNILVVDDAIDGAESLAMLLDACGHETHVAFDGLQGLAQAKRHVPHIIFLDLDMPVLDGYGAARAIRDAPDTDHPFIVALTGNADANVEQRTLAAGFDFYMRKPADPNALLALVDDLGPRAHASAQPQRASTLPISAGIPDFVFHSALDGCNMIAGVLMQGHDMTERRAASEALLGPYGLFLANKV